VVELWELAVVLLVKGETEKSQTYKGHKNKYPTVQSTIYMASIQIDFQQVA